jgi:hypothetical protein
VDHACNPSYSGGRDQEDHGLKPRQIIHDSYLEITLHKKWTGGMAQGEGPEFKPQYHIKKQNKTTEQQLPSAYYICNTGEENSRGH